MPVDMMAAQRQSQAISRSLTTARIKEKMARGEPLTASEQAIYNNANPMSLGPKQGEMTRISAELVGTNPDMQQFIGTWVRPEELEAFKLLVSDATNRYTQRGLAEAFYGDPARQAEIERVIAPQETAGYHDLEQSIRERGREESFARARSGNIGGSFEGQQQGELRTDAQTQGAQLAAGFAGQRSSLQDALEAARFRDVMGTYQMDPYVGQAIQQRLQTLGVGANTNSALQALQRQADQQRGFANDEFSRILGGFVNTGTQAINTYNKGRMLEEQREANNRRAIEGVY